MISKNNFLANKLLAHRGHDIAIMVYGTDDEIYDVCVECLDCNEVLVSAEDYGFELECEEDYDNDSDLLQYEIG